MTSKVSLSQLKRSVGSKGSGSGFSYKKELSNGSQVFDKKKEIEEIK